MTPLEDWIRGKIGLQAPDRLTPEHLAHYHLRKLQETLGYASAKSPFYRSLLPRGTVPHRIEDFLSIPFTTADVLCDHHLEFLCVSQSAVARVVTLQTWEIRPKRLYFTDSDLELTIDFFHHGMSGIVQGGQRVLILMPGEKPGSVGDLLVQALARMDVHGIVHGPVQDPGRTLHAITNERVDSLVGIPTHVLALVRHPNAARIPPGRIQSVLLSSDYVPQAIVDEVTRVWGCPVFEHYGMTEMGLGGGVHCSAHEGYHLREADLFFEIIDPDTGQPMPEGEIGEIVFSTLTREAMPILRYRTGDLSRFIPGPCPCGTMLRRLDRIRGRLKGAVNLDKGHQLSISEMDDVLFRVPGLLEYQAEVFRKMGMDHLLVTVFSGPEPSDLVSSGVFEALNQLPTVRASLEQGVLVLDPIETSEKDRIGQGMSKRKIRDLRLA